MRAPVITPFMVRQFLNGVLDPNGMPSVVLGQLKALQRRLYRQHVRAVKRETKARQYAVAGLNGKRAVARRSGELARAKMHDADQAAQ